MAVRVIVNGAQGKMGKLACETIGSHPDFELVAGLSREDNLRQAIDSAKAHIVIDLTRADCVFKNSLTILESGAHPVIGASGLQDDQIAILVNLSRTNHIGGIIVPNFSISAVLMMRFARQAARYLSEVEIIETHHRQKFDAPSGTALKTAEMIAQVRHEDQQKRPVEASIPGVLGGEYRGVPIHSLRLTGVLARQDVIFGNQGETLSISHNSIDRSSFMPGLLLCCEKVQQLDKVYYGLDHLLEE